MYEMNVQAACINSVYMCQHLSNNKHSIIDLNWLKNICNVNEKIILKFIQFCEKCN